MDTPPAPTPLQLISDAICEVAPDIDPSEVADLDRTESIRDALELDSMDQVNIAGAIFERCGVNIPEGDYSRMDTVASFEEYLGGRLEDVTRR